MSTSGYAARVGAAAFVLGVALGAPLAGAVPVAVADSPDTSVAGPGETGETARAARTARGPKSTTRSQASGRGGPPRSAPGRSPAPTPAANPPHHAVHSR
ncbi:MAG: hypothetical protein KIH64_010360, partial [Mycobacterium sp.]|nr:hypothetical protein [Mycobacterium sp.]